MIEPHRFLLCAGIAASLFVSTPSLARADDELQAAREVLKEAAEAANKKDWALCRTKAAGVWATTKHPIVASMLGACEAELGLNRDAAEHLDFFLQHDDGKHGTQADVAKEYFPKVRAKVALITVKTNDTSVEVRVDGTKTDPRVFVDPGKHHVDARKDGFTTKGVDVDATAGADLPLDLTLLPATSNGGSGHETQSKKPVWPIAVGASLTAVGLGLGIGFVVASASKDTDITNAVKVLPAKCPSSGGSAACTSIDSEISTRNTFKNVSTGSFIAGGVFAAATLGYVIWFATGNRESQKTGSVSFVVVPVATPSFEGVALGGSF